MSFLDLSLLLLPIAAATGWFAGRQTGRRARELERNYVRHFHRGLRELLSESRRDEVALFEDLSDTDRDAIDSQLAVGALFRRRGDMDKAIRLHERLLEHVGVRAEDRAAIRLELARDFDAAGLEERAERELDTVERSGYRVDEALRHRLGLRERDRDWVAAIAVARRLEARDGEAVRARIAHYECELAEDDAAAHHRERSREHLQRALSTHAGCARAHIATARLALRDECFADALVSLEAAAACRPELMPDIIGLQVEALRRGGDPVAVEAFVERVRARRNAYTVIRAVRDLIAETDGLQAADRFFKDQVLRRPSLKGLRDWTRDQLEIAGPGEREAVRVILSLLEQVTRDRSSYRCTACGFEGRDLHWRCPGCGRWDTVIPIIGAEGE